MANTKVSIDFGLIHIPVELVTAEDRSNEVSFHMIDSKDQSRIKYKRVNENTGREVDWEDIVKGYELSTGRYVIFTDEELKALETESNKSLAIDAFIDRSEIPIAMFETPYFLVPAKGGEKAYAVLQKVLENTQKFAVVQAVLRTKERLGVIFSENGKLMFDLLRYPEELKKPSQIGAREMPAVNAKEVAMAERLVKQMSAKFKPKEYKDDYLEKLKSAIKRKSSKKKVSKVITKEKPKTSKTVDIMSLLQSSLRAESKTKAHKKRATA